LIGVAGIDTQAQRQIDGFIELRVFDILQEADSVCQRIGRLRDSRPRLRNILAEFSHPSLVSHR